jgi:hypothetical protein
MSLHIQLIRLKPDLFFAFFLSLQIFGNKDCSSKIWTEIKRLQIRAPKNINLIFFARLVGYSQMKFQTISSLDLRDIYVCAKYSKCDDEIGRSGGSSERIWREPDGQRIPDRVATRRTAIRTLRCPMRPRSPTRSCACSHFKSLSQICGLGLWFATFSKICNNNKK